MSRVVLAWSLFALHTAEADMPFHSNSVGPRARKRHSAAGRFQMRSATPANIFGLQVNAVGSRQG